MPRKIVPLITGDYYHIFNRGTDKRDIFLNKGDYLRFYLNLQYFNVEEPVVHFDAAKTAYKNSEVKIKLVEVYAYSLLPNHYHLILRQLVDGGISEFMKRVSGGYTSYFNKRQEQKRTGVLFQGKFKRVHIDTDEQLNYLFMYVNENHFVHGIDVEREVCHSSSLHYQGLVKSALLKKISTPYNFNESVVLAKEIYKKRQLVKAAELLQ